MFLPLPPHSGPCLLQSLSSHSKASFRVFKHCQHVFRHSHIHSAPLARVWLWHHHWPGLCICPAHDLHHLGFEAVCSLVPFQTWIFSKYGIAWLTVSHRYQNEVQTSEMFSTAGRSVKSGLVAAAVVSSWTWAATLLQSTTVAYEYGISGPFFYASGMYSQQQHAEDILTR